MRKMRLALAVVAASSLLTVFAPSPAHASTCIFADPTLDEVVCDTVYPPVMKAVCFIANKLFGQCLA